MKELSKYSRLAGYLERLYDKLNDHFFDGQLDRPVITIQSTPRAYGHYTLYDAWSVKGAGRKEINIPQVFFAFDCCSIRNYRFATHFG